MCLHSHCEEELEMRVIIQRVTSASVVVGGAVVSSIGRGLLVLVGISRDDAQPDAEFM